MHRLVIMALLISCAAAGENLLANPGFEQLVQGHPAQWHIFVEPQQGAVGVIDDEVAAQGQYSAKLHIPKPYAEESANNWSQNILADVSGKEVVVRGRIRTEEASEAALWLQCCRMRPFRFLKFVTSKTTTPVYGTMDWTDIEMRVRVPAMTDYLVLRCVLMGQGTAWFDDLSVTEEPKEKVEPKKKPEEQKPEKDAEEKESKAEKAPPTSEDMAKAEARASKVATDSLLESHKALLETNKTLRDMNASLTSQVVALREELREIRRELAALRARSFTKSTPVAAPKPPRPPEKPEVKSEPVPPLVPHGYEQRSEAP